MSARHRELSIVRGGTARRAVRRLPRGGAPDSAVSERVRALHRRLRAECAVSPQTGRGNRSAPARRDVNPAALAGGSGAAHAYFAARSAIVDASSQVDWVKGKTIDTPFVSVPGLVTAECKKNDVASYLAVAVHGEPGLARTSDIPGDVVVGGRVQADWGLHLGVCTWGSAPDRCELFMGNLMAIVRDQAAAYGRGKR